MNVSQLGTGDLGIIHAIEEDATALRLNELGIFCGDTIRCSGTAPSGCPILLEAGQVSFALRKEQAESIKIQRIA